MSIPDNLISCQKQTGPLLSICGNEALQEALKCYLCDKILSVPPIYNHEHETICGRCKFVDKSEDCKWGRQTVYETLAQYMIFPCCNSTYGCKAELKWGEVAEHENTCLYKKLNCPFFNDDMFKTGVKCRWTGSGPGLNEHLENYHADLIQKLPEITFSEIRSSQIYLTKILKQLMIVVVKYEPPERFACLVMVNGTSTDCDAYRYQVELCEEGQKNSLILRKTRLEDAVGLEENMNDPEKMITIDLAIIRQLLKSSSSIVGRFGIIKKSKKDMYPEKSPNSSQVVAPNNETFLRELECPICKNYMIPPIHICRAGHSFCGTCRDQMDECPTCRNPFYEGRNYTLEKLTCLINYPCMYKEAGCYVTCSSEKLKQHEQDCNFSGTHCFLNCTSGSVVNMFKHLNEKHQDCLIVCGELHILDVSDCDDENLKFFALCFGNDIFRLAVKYDGVWMKFALHQFGVKQSYYTYELEIICSTECTEKITITKECAPMSTSVLNKCISVSEDMIEKFISEEDLIFYKIHLKKIS